MEFRIRTGRQEGNVSFYIRVRRITFSNSWSLTIRIRSEIKKKKDNNNNVWGTLCFKQDVMRRYFDVH